jgi:paired amphipathic helix protein Sin3a
MDVSQQDDDASMAAIQEPTTTPDAASRPAQASDRAQSAGELETLESVSTQRASEPPIAAGSGERQLNVTDALGYLDTVKSKFYDQPEVYSKFLDIMKDFKNQAYALYLFSLIFPSLFQRCLVSLFS